MEKNKLISDNDSTDGDKFRKESRTEANKRAKQISTSSPNDRIETISEKITSEKSDSLPEAVLEPFTRNTGSNSLDEFLVRTKRSFHTGKQIFDLP